LVNPSAWRLSFPDLRTNVASHIALMLTTYPHRQLNRSV
jgi:hypothetical protein